MKIISYLILCLSCAFQAFSVTTECCNYFANEHKNHNCINYLSLGTGSGDCHILTWQEERKEKAIMIDAGFRDFGRAEPRDYIVGCIEKLLKDIELCAIFTTHSDMDHINLLSSIVKEDNIIRSSDFKIHFGGRELDYKKGKKRPTILYELDDAKIQYDFPSTQEFTFGRINVYFSSFLRDYYAMPGSGSIPQTPSNSTGAIICCRESDKTLVTFLGDIPIKAFNTFHNVVSRDAAPAIAPDSENKLRLARYVNESWIIDVSHHGLSDNGEWDIILTLSYCNKISTISGTPEGRHPIKSEVAGYMDNIEQQQETKAPPHIITLERQKRQKVNCRIFSTYDEHVIWMEINADENYVYMDGNQLR